MEQFQGAFVNEAKDLLESLESALLTLESNFDDQDMIAEVFRVMHSLKGTASMFGFDKIGELTHELETIYDLIRAGQLALSKSILSVSLATLDLIHNLLHDPYLDDSDHAKRFNLVQDDIRALVKDIGYKEEIHDGSFKPVKALDAIATYHVKVVFDKQIFTSGSNPVYLIEDVLELGQTRVFPFLLALNDEIDFEHCLFYWEVILETNKDISEIEEVFMFVEDECQLQIEKIFDGEIFSKPEVISVLDDFGINTFDLNLLKQKLEPPSKERTSNSTKLTRESIRVDSVQVDELMKLVSQLVTAQASLDLLAQESSNSKLEEVTEDLDKLTRQLRDNAFGMSLIPLDNLFMRFRRLVRDTSSILEKPIEFITKGEDTKLDKKIIETLSEPLMHVLRNSLDHGIESHTARLEAGKPAKGLIEVSAYNSGAFVNIRVRDDGGGIDPFKIREKAIKKGLIGEQDELSEQEMQELIFAPGFSTAEEVSDLSGRGVGMDVVRQNIQSLRGEIILDSEVGKGTTLTLKLPLTLSIIDGLQVKVLGTHYIIPVLEIDRCIEFSRKQIEDNFNHLLLVEGEQIPFVNLIREFGLSSSEQELLQVVFVWCQGRKIGLVVEEVMGENQAVLKPLGKYYRNNDLFSGATILGDGTVSLVIDPGRVISYFHKELNLANG